MERQRLPDVARQFRRCGGPRRRPRNPLGGSPAPPDARAELQRQRLTRRLTVAVDHRARRCVHVPRDLRPGPARVQAKEVHARLHAGGRLRVRAERLVDLSRNAGGPPATGVLERAERCHGAVLREPLHVAVPLELAGPSRHRRQRPVRLPLAAARAVAVVPARPRLQAPRRHGRVRHLRRQEQRRLEQLRRGRRHAEPQAGTGVPTGRRNGLRELRPASRARCACGGSIPRTAASVWSPAAAPEHAGSCA